MFRPLILAALLLGAPTAALATDCAPGFASMLPRIVRKAEVAAVDETYKVRLWQFCKGLEFHDLGNAAALTRTIAANPLLADPIKEKGWRPDDVMFVRLGPNFIDLWLHRDP
ncbi:MAG: hypothetical protein ABIQ30_14490 [Devosia sp.]